MVTAIVLLNTARGRVNEIAGVLAEMEGVTEVYSVGGRYDLVVVIRVHSNEELADLVTEHLQNLAGIESTETLIAFRAYSRHDLERMFSIGL
ncbi:MAG TPA: Lrp/AsnC ligand binding domain-containing protein [Nitrococcus sp.]|nr:Lrp/AsnC ligand binding domain-containing protein [Nitrococcus sp.]